MGWEGERGLVEAIYSSFSCLDCAMECEKGLIYAHCTLVNSDLHVASADVCSL